MTHIMAAENTGIQAASCCNYHRRWLMTSVVDNHCRRDYMTTRIHGKIESSIESLLIA